MIRSTVAHVDLAALQANFKAIQTFLERRAGPARPRRTRRESSRSSRPTRTDMAPERVALALEAAGARSARVRGHRRRRSSLRRAGVRVPILVFGALSVSDLDGLFEFSLTPTISTPAAARAVQAAAAKHATTIGYHLKIDTGMNRLGFRHDNLRRTLPERAREPEPAARGGLHALRDGRRCRSAVLRPAASELRSARLQTIDAIADAGRVRRRSIHAANSAATLRDSRVWARHGAARPAALRHRAAAAGVDDSADARSCR